MITYSFRYICHKCNQVFEGHSTVPTNPDYDQWYKGFLCIKCFRQTALDKWNFNVD